MQKACHKGIQKDRKRNAAIGSGFYTKASDRELRRIFPTIR